MPVHRAKRTRTVHDEQKQELHTHLMNNISLLQHSTTSDHKLDSNLEFFHAQVVSNCHLLFTMEDLLKHFKTWQEKYAKGNTF